MAEEASYVYDDSVLKYDFGSGHPFKVWRVKLTKELLSARLHGLNAVPARSASRVEVELFHIPDYLSLVERLSALGTGMLDGGDTPAFLGCYEASMSIVGATLQAIDLVLRCRSCHSASFSGGLHHAGRGNASGFCILNDCAVGIAYLRKNFSRVAYIDLDAHHGDGVMYGFYSDPGVINIDFHQDGRTIFPGTGSHLEAGSGSAKGMKLNLPLPPGSADDVLFDLFNEFAVPLLEETKPEFILVQCGADGLRGDPLAGLAFTKHGYIRVVQELHALSHRLCGGRLVLLGGGGYNPEPVAECWAEEYLIISGYAPERLPESSTSLPSVLRRVEDLKASVRKDHPLFSR
ncbi:MAG: acetoin utilization protein AcuC [Candidatus Verstraetearchaeota archaeon]|nr:acetoin utilization protein AcuC [Candidatus Verstraetearchaeota archaeon]